MNKFLRDFPYQQTFSIVIINLILILVFATAIQLELLYRCERRVNFEELNLNNLSKFCTIEQLEMRLKHNPSDSIASIKLAMLYEDLNDYSKANYYYKDALRTSQRSNFSLYKYAMFLAKNGMINLSTTLAEEIDTDTAKCCEYKAKIFELIGDYLDNNDEFEASNKAFQVAHKYAKNTNDKEYFENICEKYANSYSKMADTEIKNGNIEEAIFIIKNSFKIKKTPLASYKLGLILLDSQPQEAQRYISYTVENNPYLVNPYLYNKLLNDLYNEANIENIPSKINLYSKKISNFSALMERIYLFKNDIIISNVKIQKTKKKFKTTPDYNLVFDIENATKYDIKKIFIKADMYLNDQQKVLFKEITTRKKYIKSSEIVKSVSDIYGVKSIDLENANDATIRFYGRKDKKAPWTLISIKRVNF